MPAGKFRVYGVWNSNRGLKFQAQGRVYQDTRKRISSLHGSPFLLSRQSGNKTEVLKSPPSSPLIRYSGKLTPRVKGMKSTKQWVGFQVKQWVAPGVGRSVFKILALPSYFHFVSSEEKVSRAKRKFVSSYLGILYLALGISNPYLNFKLRRHKIIPLAPRN